MENFEWRIWEKKIGNGEWGAWGQADSRVQLVLVPRRALAWLIRQAVVGDEEIGFGLHVDRGGMALGEALPRFLAELQIRHGGIGRGGVAENAADDETVAPGAVRLGAVIDEVDVFAVDGFQAHGRAVGLCGASLNLRGREINSSSAGTVSSGRSSAAWSRFHHLIRTRLHRLRECSTGRR
ncbi:hypothetical protein LBMAG56_13350 [Verrucomicrobiota bacterium]|nr:hypothetical protein LBMAG56_13350 [Verrucomicrobiota bacterium]